MTGSHDWTMTEDEYHDPLLCPAP